MNRGNHYAVQADRGRNSQFKRKWSEPPHEGLRPVGEIATALTSEIARRVVHHWLQKADQLGGEDRVACLATAARIAHIAGLKWSDFIPGRAA